MPGYNESEEIEKKKKFEKNYKERQKDKEPIDWNNKKGEKIHLNFHKEKKFFRFHKRIEKEAPVFGMRHAGDDHHSYNSGSTITINSNTGTGTITQNHDWSVSYVDLEQEYSLENEELVSLAKKWLKYCRTFWPNIILLFAEIAAFSASFVLIFGADESGENTMAGTGIMLLILSAILLFFSVKKIIICYIRKHIVKKAKKIWKENK